MTTKEKLLQYSAAMEDVRRLRWRLMEARARAEQTAASLEGMPTAHNPQRMQANVEAMEEAERRLNRAIFTAYQRKKTVTELCQKAETDRQRRYLHMRYAMRLPAREIAKREGIGERTVNLILSAGIRTIEGGECKNASV